MKSPVPIMSSGVSGSSLKKDQKTKKPRAKPTHPRTAEMVTGAIGALKERGGSSLQAIKKYMSSTYKVDADKQSPFIKRYLKTAVAGGNLVQTKGKGAAGSFKLTDGTKTKKRSVVLKNTPLKKAVKTSSTPKKTTGKKSVKKTVVKGAPVKPTAEKKKITKGPAAKPPKAKIATKVKAPPKPTKKGAKKVGKVVKAKKTAKKTTGKKK